MVPNFSFIISGKLAGSGFPGSGWSELSEDLEDLITLGIRAIVTLTENSLDKKTVKDYNIKYLHIPILDYLPPTIEQIFQFIEFTNSCIDENKGVLVHCRAGIGRTGTMLAAYLISKGYTAKDAIADIRKKRFGSIETIEQENILYEFEIVFNNTDKN